MCKKTKYYFVHFVLYKVSLLHTWIYEAGVKHAPPREALASHESKDLIFIVMIRHKDKEKSFKCATQWKLMH